MNQPRYRCVALSSPALGEQNVVTAVKLCECNAVTASISKSQMCNAEEKNFKENSFKTKWNYMNLKDHDSLYFFQIFPSIFMCKESHNA